MVQAPSLQSKPWGLKGVASPLGTRGQGSELDGWGVTGCASHLKPLVPTMGSWIEDFSGFLPLTSAGHHKKFK